jgi:PPM family protein phosphatase
MGRIQDYWRRVVGAPDVDASLEKRGPELGAERRAERAVQSRPDAEPSTAPLSDIPAGEIRRRIESHGLSHIGLVRKSNEDHFVIASLQRSVQVRQTNLEDREIFERLCGPKAYLFAVADGVGGLRGGRLASGMAVETIVEYLGETVASYHGVGAAQERNFLEPLSLAVQRAHDRLLMAFQSQRRGGPATTLTMALLVWPRLFLVHVGDSRAYHQRGGQFRRLTRDQTVGAFFVDQQGMSEQQAEAAGLNNVLASAIGAEDMSPSVDVIDLEPGDVLLLCTDGLTRHVSEERIAEILARTVDVEASCHELVDLALAGGGRDNITAIVARTLPS